MGRRFGLLIATLGLLAPTLTLAEAPTVASYLRQVRAMPTGRFDLHCVDTPRSSFIRRVCYDAPKSFMVIKLKETWYPYCEIDAATVQQLITAGSAGTFIKPYAADQMAHMGHSIAAITQCRSRPAMTRRWI